MQFLAAQTGELAYGSTRLKVLDLTVICHGVVVTYCYRMVRSISGPETVRPPQYEQVRVSDVSRSRRGKHHQLLQGILLDLESLPTGTAMKISVPDLPGITLANLRSAVHRATARQKIQIETASDDEHLYVWRR